MQPAAVYHPPGAMPNRVQAAFNFLHYAMSIEREWDGLERATYNAAVVVVRDYLNGEMDFGDVAPRYTMGTDEDGNSVVII